FTSLDELIKHAPATAVFDIAVPGSAVIGILERLPAKDAILMQKPMGENYEEAKKILAIVREKQLLAGINFQLRYAPFITEARTMIDQGIIGDLLDIEVN